MPALDPSGFQIAVVIVTADRNRRIPLWLRQSSADAVFVDGSLQLIQDLGFDLPIVESVEMEIGRGMNIKITVEVSAPYELGLRLLDTDLFVIGNTIEVQLGYPRLGRFTPWASAMAAKPSMRITPEDGLSVTMNGEGGGFASFRGVSSRIFTSMSYAQIVREIAERYGWIPRLPSFAGAGDPLDQVRAQVSQSNMTDWFFLQHILRAANMDAWIGPDPDQQGRTAIFVARRSETMAQVPRMTFVARGRADFDTVFPIFDYESEAHGVWLPAGAVSAVMSRDIDPDSGEVVERQASAATSQVPATGEAVPAEGSARVGDHQASLAPAPRDARDTGEYMTVSARDPRSAEQVVSSYREEIAVRGAIAATITSFGIPELLPLDMIKVAGMGRLDGNYGIETIQHKADASEWTMTLKLINNATSTDFFMAAIARDPAQTNTQDAPEPVGDAGSGSVGEVVPEPEA